MIITYKFRVKDKHATELNRQARVVNYVWNFCEETQRHALKWGKKWPTGYDLQNLTAGSCKDLNIHSHTIKRVCAEYELSRKINKKRSLKWRGKKSLGWVPFNTDAISFKNGLFFFRKSGYGVWLSRIITSDMKFGAGSFNQDAKGNWYINVSIKIAQKKSNGGKAIGIDLGLKDFAVMSDGEKVQSKQFYRDLEPKLAISRRARKKARTRAIHAKIANRRKDFLHKLSTDLVSKNGAIFVGNVNAAGLAKTNMAKSVLDAGWSTFRAMLQYKSHQAGVLFEEVNEAYSTQTCSCCGALPDSRPKGITGLEIREWSCTECGEHHDRDVNAAKIILARGHARLAGGSDVSQMSKSYRFSATFPLG